MIRFPCRCGHEFNVTDEQAADSIQCPRCGLLCDVPGLGDLANIEADGTYGVEVQPVRKEPNRLAEAYRAFTNERYDEEGNEFDLRTHAEELDLKPVAPERAKPRYDPETGELVRELDVKPDPVLDAHVNPGGIPMAKAALEYAGSDTPGRVSPAKLAASLFSPANVFVLMIVFGLHLLWDVGAFVVYAGMVFAIMFPLALSILILAHFGACVDEFGPRDHDELPRPLRDVNWYDDIWEPFIGVTGSFMMAYLPLWFVGRLPLPFAARAVLAWTALVAGTIAFPAVLLTMRTSGSAINLRPDRVWAVIRACGLKYIVAVLVYVAALVTYPLGVLGSLYVFAKLFVPRGVVTNPLANWYIAYPLLFLGSYLIQYLGAYLGLLYRAHHPQFPWLFQHHVPDPDRPKKRPASLGAARAARAAAPAPVKPVPVKPVPVIPVATVAPPMGKPGMKARDPRARGGKGLPDTGQSPRRWSGGDLLDDVRALPGERF